MRSSAGPTTDSAIYSSPEALGISTPEAARDRLIAIVDSELTAPLPAAISAFAAALATRGNGCVDAVLFYGSNLRSGALDGVLDFYVLVDSLRGWHQSKRAAAANRVLPPNILYVEQPHDARMLRAKVAVLRSDQFHRAMRQRSLDTTMWARYSQPAGLAWVRDDAAQRATAAAVADAVITAALWAGHLGPIDGSAGDYWQALYRRTYSAELRVEKASRADSLVGFGSDRYAAVLPLAWEAAGLPFTADSAGVLHPQIGPGVRRRALAGWALRHALGKPLNFARLVKSAYTFDGGVDYLLWKIERHSGQKFPLTDWQRRHPILASPRVLWDLRRRGAIR